MEVITGVNNDKLSFEQNAEGKYDIMITHDKKKYRTGFIYDSIKLFNEYQLRVSQADSEGNKKFGMIAVCSDEIVLPCSFKSEAYNSRCFLFMNISLLSAFFSLLLLPLAITLPPSY